MTAPTTSAAWATLRVELAGDCRDRSNAEVAALGLEGLAALLAQEPDVGGVETRDSTTLGGVTEPELWVYTTPDALAPHSATATAPHSATAPAPAPLGDRAHALAATFGLVVRLTARVREDDDWRDEWKRYYRPRVFGRPPHQLLLRPSWVPRSEGDPELEVVVDPGRAFGTGLHESTRLCLHRLCAVAPAIHSPARVLDLGCGSGILALAAARLCPTASLWAVDVDPEAAETTRENVALNGLGERIQVAAGALDALQPQRFDLLVANIRPVVLVPLAGKVSPWLAPSARVILSGIFGDEVARVRHAWLGAGFQEIATTVEGDWSLLDLRAPPP